MNHGYRLVTVLVGLAYVVGQITFVMWPDNRPRKCRRTWADESRKDLDR